MREESSRGAKGYHMVPWQSGDRLTLQFHHETHLGMSSGFLPEPALGPRFLLSLGLTRTHLLAY